MAKSVGIVSGLTGHHKNFAGADGRKFVRMLIKLRLKFYQVECGRFTNQGARFTTGRGTKVKDYFNHTVISGLLSVINGSWRELRESAASSVVANQGSSPLPFFRTFLLGKVIYG